MSKAAEQGESLVAILSELADLVSSARSMPMSASVLVNRAEVLELIDSATAVLPDQITRADSVVADAESVLQRARREAATIVEKAQARADELISRESVIAEANERAAKIVADAEAAAEKLSREADDFCDRQLAQFEIDLNSIASQVSAGRARLMERTRGRTQKSSETPDGGDQK